MIDLTPLAYLAPSQPVSWLPWTADRGPLRHPETIPLLTILGSHCQSCQPGPPGSWRPPYLPACLHYMVLYSLPNVLHTVHGWPTEHDTAQHDLPSLLPSLFGPAQHPVNLCLGRRRAVLRLVIWAGHLLDAHPPRAALVLLLRCVSSSSSDPGPSWDASPTRPHSHTPTGPHGPPPASCQLPALPRNRRTFVLSIDVRTLCVADKQICPDDGRRTTASYQPTHARKADSTLPATNTNLEPGLFGATCPFPPWPSLKPHLAVAAAASASVCPRRWP